MSELHRTPAPTRDALLAKLPALAERLAEGAARRELERELPFEGMALFKQSGLGTLRIPANVGGPGGSVADVIEVVATLASAESNLAHALRIQLHTTELLAVSPHSADNEVQARRVLGGALATAGTQIVVSRLAVQAAERMFEAGGASATSRALNFDRHWRNLRTIFSHNPLTHKARILGDYHLNGTETHPREGKVF